MPRTLAAALLCMLVLPAPSAARPWRWPVRGPVLERFELGVDRFSPGQHRGIDIAAPAGTPVRAACAGRVSFAGVAGDSGRVVSVVCGRLTATYLHLSRLDVRRGRRVGRGALIGAVGRSGRPRARRPHLHLGARLTGRRWDYVDPLALLGEPTGEPPAPLVGDRRVPPVVGPGVRSPAVGPAAVPRALASRAPSPVVAGRSPSPAPSLPWTAWAGLGLLALATPMPVLRARHRHRGRGRGTLAGAGMAHATRRSAAG